MAVAPFDPTAAATLARGLAHQFRQDGGFIFRDDEHKAAKLRALIAQLRAAGRPRAADALTAKLDAWCAVYEAPVLDLVEALETQARGFAWPEEAPAAVTTP